MVDEELELTPRIENVRDKSIDHIKIHDLNEIKAVVDDTINSINKNMNLANVLVRENKLDEANSILRSQIVFIESVFDYFCHTIVKYGLKKIYEGIWERTDGYNNYLVPLKIIADSNYEDISFESIINYVNFKISPYTFLGYDDFKKAMNLINTNIISDLRDKLYPGAYESDGNVFLKERISNIYERRNKIVHQADREHVTGEKVEITKSETKEYVRSIKEVMNYIIEIVKSY